MSNPWPQVFRGRGSVYALDEDTKQWADRGASGTVILFQSVQNRQDVRIKWEKNQQEIWWRLTSSKLKPKGERALVLKAWATSTNQQEILAIRFGNQGAAIQFAKKYHNIFPLSISNTSQIENIFKQNSSVSNHEPHKNNGHLQHLKPKHHFSMASLPKSVIGDEAFHAQAYNQQFSNNVNNFQYNGNNNTYAADNNVQSHRRPSNPAPPPRSKKKPRPRPNAQYVRNGQPVHVANGSESLDNGNNHMFKPGAMPDLDPLPAEPLPANLSVNGANGAAKRMVKASPDMRPPVFSRPLPNVNVNVNGHKAQMLVNNAPVELEYGHNANCKEWKCAVCTYQNTEHFLKCAMCGLAKKPALKADEEDVIYEEPEEMAVIGVPHKVHKWECTACTFSNHSWTDRCAVCSAKRRNEPEKPQNNLNIGPKKQEAISLHKSMSARIEQEILESDNIGSPVYNAIPQKKFLFEPNGGVNRQPWSCSICTLSNRATNARCEACNTARTVNPYVDQGQGLNLAMNENQVNNMMHHMIHQPEQQYQPPRPQQPQFDSSYNDYDKMMNISYGVDGNPFNIKFDYNDPFKANQYGDFSDNLFEPTVEDFSLAASDIACYNDTPSSVFSTLRSVSKKLLKDDPRYRTLDTTNPKVMERLIGFSGVLDFLMLLGFESDAMGMKLICQNKPAQQVVQSAITVLNSYQQRFRMTNNGGGNLNGMGMGMMGVNGMDAISPNNDVDTQGGWDDDANQADNENKNDILTLEQIILWSTHENMQDNDTMETLIMTHKMFTDSLTLLRQLRKRFFVPIPPDILNSQIQQEKQMLIKEFQTGVQKRIQLKVIKALRDWMKKYWFEDFDKNSLVQVELQEWLKELSVYNELDIHNINCIWIQKLYNAVKKEYLRLQSIDWEKELEKQLNILSFFDDIDIGDLNKMNTFLAKSTAEELADQITLMDYRLFSRIEPRECVHQRWKDQNNKKLAPNILSLIQQFNNFTIFIQIQILRERSLKKRGTAIKRIIKMGQHFKSTRNYNSLCAVFSALNSAPIHRLKLAWHRVPERQRVAFEGWSVIFCRDFNHRNLRSLLRKAGGNPCIPHIGVFLQDLVFIDEGNKKKVAVEAFNGNQMLNFNKCVRIADRIKNLQLFQHHKYNNQIQENKRIQKVILMEFEKLKDVTEDQIWDMSTEIKKQDQREARQPLGFFGGGGNRNAGVNQIPPPQAVQQ